MVVRRVPLGPPLGAHNRGIYRGIVCWRVFGGALVVGVWCGGGGGTALTAPSLRAQQHNNNTHEESTRRESVTLSPVVARPNRLHSFLSSTTFRVRISASVHAFMSPQQAGERGQTRLADQAGQNGTVWEAAVCGRKRPHTSLRELNEENGAE